MRLFVSVLASAAMIFSASMAGAAVTYTAVSDVDLSQPIAEGTVVTIDITLRSDGEAAFGIGGSATGYDTGVVQFQSGTAVSDVLVQACLAGFGCLNGIGNDVAGPLAENTDNPLGPEVQIVNGLLLGGTSFDGSADEGVDGQAGSAQFQLVFLAVGAGTTSINIGANLDFGDALIVANGVQGATTNAVVDITVIPEPGTALLMGLGLAGLAGAGRRE